MSKSRTCQEPGCSAILSLYNREKTCFLHTEAKPYTPIVRGTDGEAQDSDQDAIFIVPDTEDWANFKAEPTPEHLEYLAKRRARAAEKRVKREAKQASLSDRAAIRSSLSRSRELFDKLLES